MQVRVDVVSCTARRNDHLKGRGAAPMQTYIAHYRSPTGASKRAKGAFEFESDARANTKANQHDARVRMLELYGSDAVSWVIEKVERKGAGKEIGSGQLELDFRAPKPVRKRAKKKEYW